MQFSEDTVKLLNQVNQVYPGSVVLRGSGEATGKLTHDQVSTDMLGTRLMVEVTDATAPDFSATQELLNMMLTLSGYPQVYFQLKSEDINMTDQLMVMSTYLYQPALRAITYKEQAKHGLVTAAVVKAFANGVMSTLTPEANNDRSEAALRLLTLLDARVFMNAVPTDIDTAIYTDSFADAFPEAWEAAGHIFATMKVDDIKDPFTVHRAVIAAFKGFDAQMIAWNLPELKALEFATLTPVLSERQLRLPLAQVFDIKHTEMTDRNTEKSAYVGLSKSEGQNSFVISVPDENQPEFFKALYQTPVREVLEQIGQPFVVRQ
ncbi:IpaB/EvcA family protein [Weissella confusa]|uniref:IpaB/EvcA family protein n=1 Tax=Weissella confusa TaxID=1583 RepID=UPI00376EA48B